MKKVRQTALWFFMTCKRLCRKYSFLVILLMIPILLPLANMAMQGESGVLKIALSYEEEENPGAQAVVEKLKSEKSVLLYTVYETPEKAQEAVENGQADGAWVFAENFSEAVRAHAERRRSAPLVTVLERESTVPLGLAREKLYGAVYPQISYAIYENFVQKSFSADAAEKAEKYYLDTAHSRSVIQTEKLHESKSAAETNYLTAPLRGLLSVLILLISLASALYYLEDDCLGRYDQLPRPKRILSAIGICTAGTLMAGVAVFLALFVSGIHTSFWREAAAMALYVPAAAGFGVAVAMLFKSTVRFGACIPFIIIGSIALSPIFFHVKTLPLLRVLLPTTYYLKAIHDIRYLLYMVIYIVCVFGFAVCISACKSKMRKSL
ncbi:MAG: ABC transporter permease [Clostridia bacterium]|nr:ABC transporter permease [Clostridia bacterium]